MKRLLFVLAIIPFVSNSQDFDYLPNSLDSSENQIVHHTYYSLSYSEEHEQPEWVFYEIKSERILGLVLRKSNFRRDNKISSKSSSLLDFNGTGYDRGHLVPAGDMSFSSIAMNESFLMSNMSPQTPSFNRGIWKKLESLIRKWGTESSIYVVTGPILNNCYETIGPNKVCVPSHFYKVIFEPTEKKMIAFVLEHTAGKKTLAAYVESVDFLEGLTGIDFFPKMEDELEQRLEAEVDIQKWTW